MSGQASGWSGRSSSFGTRSPPAFFSHLKGMRELIHRPKDWRDQSIPSGTGISVQNLLRLHPVFDRRGYQERAEAVVEVYARQLDQNPWGTATLLLAYDGLVRGATEVVLVAGPDDRESLPAFRRAIGRRYLPHGIVHLIESSEAEDDRGPPPWRGKRAERECLTAYVCRGESCSPPVTDPAELNRMLDVGLGETAPTF